MEYIRLVVRSVCNALAQALYPPLRLDRSQNSHWICSTSRPSHISFLEDVTPKGTQQPHVGASGRLQENRASSFSISSNCIVMLCLERLRQACGGIVCIRKWGCAVPQRGVGLVQTSVSVGHEHADGLAVQQATNTLNRTGKHPTKAACRCCSNN